MINFGSMPQRSGTWAWFKNLVQLKSCAPQFEENDTFYYIYAYDGPEAIYCQIWKGELPASVAVTDSQAQNDADKEEFETHWKPTANHSLVARDSRGLPTVAQEKPDSAKATLYSHDWCDKRTWYEGAIRVVEEVATDTGDHLSYQLAHTWLIDSYHARMTQEDSLVSSTGHSYRVLILVDGVTKQEQDPHLASGGDYLIDYATGTITFLSALDPAAVIQVTYHYAASSVFTVKPSPGKVLVLDFVEVQFSEDIILTDSVIFQPRGLVDIFAPSLVAAGYVPSGTIIPLGAPLVYKSMRDFMNDACRSYPSYPAMGGDGWRGSPVTRVFDWDYVRATSLRSTLGLELQIKLQHDVPFGGSYATATFYCSSVADSPRVGGE